jgi:hypothetical protein
VVLIFLAFCVVVFGGVRVAHLFSFLCCILCFVCLRFVACNARGVCSLKIVVDINNGQTII